MVYAYDKWIELPTKDIYDTQMMLASINAAKDMYDKGQAAIKDFYKTYGDFTSPFRKDMEAYDAIVNKPVRDMMNYMYENGIDPLRSAEGRAAIMQLINTVPTGTVNQLRESAEIGKEYQKNLAKLQAAGKYNPEFEKMMLGGRSIDDYSTLNDGIWQRISPSEYKDLNQYTSHIFDKIDDSFIGVDKNGYEWYGVTPQMGMNALTPDTLGGLVNSDLGRFHLNNARNDLIAQGNLNPTDEEVMDQFRKNIIAANTEAWHRNRRITEEKKQQMDISKYATQEAIKDRYMRARAADKAASESGGGKQQKIPYDFMKSHLQNSVANWFGTNGIYYDPSKMPTGKIIAIQREALNKQQTGPYKTKKVQDGTTKVKGIRYGGKEYTIEEAKKKGIKLDNNTTYIQVTVPKYKEVPLNRDSRKPWEKVDSIVQKNTISGRQLAYAYGFKPFSQKVAATGMSPQKTMTSSTEYALTEDIANKIFNSATIYNSMMGNNTTGRKTVTQSGQDLSKCSFAPTGGRLGYVDKNGRYRVMSQVIVRTHDTQGNVTGSYVGYYDMGLRSQKNTTQVDPNDWTRTHPISEKANAWARASATTQSDSDVPVYDSFELPEGYGFDEDYYEDIE